MNHESTREGERKTAKCAFGSSRAMDVGSREHTLSGQAAACLERVPGAVTIQGNSRDTSVAARKHGTDTGNQYIALIRLGRQMTFTNTADNCTGESWHPQRT
jgi:hypothetical protein